MTQYLLSVHGDPEQEDAYLSDEEMQRAFAQVDALNTEIQEAGAWVFGGGLQPASTATVVREEGEGIVLTDGPYLESKELIGGFWILECADLDEALAWARKATVACMGPVEVRPFQEEPEDA